MPRRHNNTNYCGKFKPWRPRGYVLLRGRLRMLPLDFDERTERSFYVLPKCLTNGKTFLVLFYVLVILVLIIVTLTGYTLHLDSLEPLESFQNRSLSNGISPQDKELFKQMLNFVDKLASALNVTYFLYGGTLIGSLRHGDVLPWDDDLDLAMDQDDVSRINASIKSMDQYETMLTDSQILKLWRKDAPIDTGYSWRWPFIDIFLFKKYENNSIQFMSWGNKTYESSLIFPLSKGELMGLQIPIPGRALEMLASEYGEEVLDDCKTHFWSHKEEKAIYDYATAKCSELISLYKFRTNETMKLQRAQY